MSIPFVRETSGEPDSSSEPLFVEPPVGGPADHMVVPAPAAHRVEHDSLEAVVLAQHPLFSSGAARQRGRGEVEPLLLQIGEGQRRQVCSANSIRVPARCSNTTEPMARPMASTPTPVASPPHNAHSA